MSIERAAQERQRQIYALLGAAIVDPDPEREVIACDDCRTPVLAAFDNLMSIAHDSTCPTLRAMTAAERIESVGDLFIVHTARGQQG